MIAGGNWWRANEIVMRHLTRQPDARYRSRDKAGAAPCRLSGTSPSASTLAALEPKAHALAQKVEHAVGFCAHWVRQHVNARVRRVVRVRDIHDGIPGVRPRPRRLTRCTDLGFPHLEALLVTDARFHFDLPSLSAVLDLEVKAQVIRTLRAAELRISIL